MNIFRTLCTSVLLASVASLVGCGQGASEASTGVTPGSQQGTLLASVDKGNGHVIEFRLDLAGDLMVVETGPFTEPPVLTDTAGKTASELYRMVNPGAAVPPALAEADARAAARLHEPSLQAPPPPESGPDKGAGPVLYNASQQAWFKSTFCVDNTETSTLETCLQGYSWVHLGWNYGMQYQFQLLNGSEGQTATVTAYNWTNGAAQTVMTQSLAPGFYYHGGWPVQSPSWHTANLDNAGANTLVSGAAQNCGEADEWSCLPNCGACDPAQSGGCEIVGSAGQSWCENGNGE